VSRIVFLKLAGGIWVFKLLLATNNPGKILELRDILSELDVDLLSPRMAGLMMEVQETGMTYGENAALKAKAFAEASGMFALADDSGLEVDHLGGEPGIHSARYAPQPGATDGDRRRLLLQRLSGLPRPWSAQFRCVVALADPSDSLYLSEGACRGEILPGERGQGGFGYDPIFLVEGSGSTMAELPPEVKNQISHRANAVRGLLPILRGMIS
jgi:XTP/dITP diphosphohydrolase